MEINELFQISCLPYTEHTTQENESLPPTPSKDGCDPTCRPKSGQKRKASISSSNITFGEFDDERAIRRSCIETLNDKEDKKWPPFMHLFDHNSPSNVSR